MSWSFHIGMIAGLAVSNTIIKMLISGYSFKNALIFGCISAVIYAILALTIFPSLNFF